MSPPGTGFSLGTMECFRIRLSGRATLWLNITESFTLKWLCELHLNKKASLPHAVYILMGKRKSIVKQLKYMVYKMSINKWMDEQIWYAHTMDHYSATKRNSLSCATWMTLKNIMVRGKRPVTKQYTILFTWNSRKVKSIVLESRSEIAGDWFPRNTKEAVGRRGIEMFSLLIMVVVVTHVYIYLPKLIELYTIMCILYYL